MKDNRHKFIIGKIVVVEGFEHQVFREFTKFNKYGKCLADLPSFIKSFPLGLVTYLKKPKASEKRTWFVAGADHFGYSKNIFKLRLATKREAFLYHLFNKPYVLGKDNDEI